MQRVLTIFFILLQISDITWAIGDKPQPYCDRNITDTSYKSVIKTRTVKVNKKGFFNKISMKKETKIEEYEELEPIIKNKLERACCDGYKMSELMLCEPQCVQNGCPEHSTCVEPEVCECKKGYFSARSKHDDKNYCEPLCEKTCPEHSECVGPNQCACIKGYHVGENKQCKPYCPSGCPHNGICLAPNMCECKEGYKAEQGTCLPICSLGDQCQNGRCVDTNICQCNYGYVFNSETHICEPNMAKFREIEENENIESSSVNYEEITESIDQAEIALEVETDIDSANDGIDPNEVFDENIDFTTYSSTEYADDSSIKPSSQKCPDDYVFHQGQCKPLKFASLEIDCRFKPCNDPQATCLENGTCACNEGYKWFRMPEAININHSNKTECLTLSEYQARLQQLHSEKATPTGLPLWTTVFFIALGTIIMVIALVYISLRFWRSQRGELDVEAKNLSCAYDNRVCLDSEKSVI